MNWNSIEAHANVPPETMSTAAEITSIEEEDLVHAREACARFPQCHHHPVCIISVRDQVMKLVEDDQIVQTYPVSTSRYGTGAEVDSFKTPTGAHRIAERIGDGVPLHTIFRARVAQPEIAEVEMRPHRTKEDCITTRILWLDGLEPGRNQGGDVDSKERFIYIHGTHEEGLLGQAASVGCIRMSATDVAELFDRVQVGTLVLILPT